VNVLGSGGPWALPAVYAAGALGGGGLALAAYASGGGLWLAWAVLVLAAGLVGWLAHVRVMARRDALRRIQDALERVARGRTSGRLIPTQLGDLAQTAAAVNRVLDVLDDTKERLGGVAQHLVELPGRTADTLDAVQRSAEDQEAAVEETAALHTTINASIRAIADEVEQLARANDESASSILELGSAIEQVARSAATLQSTVESSTSSLHQVGDNIKLVAQSSDSVLEVAEETAASVMEMDRSIQEVGVHARGASELTDRVSRSADEGSRAVGATIDGIADIREATQAARGALEGLAERIGEIGEIATVIGAITDETNLLSLNAAIIAAQAGEHGKAFAVVADQVKTLARRTSQSTKEISGLIGAIQEQSGVAVQAMAAGIEAVEQGVSRSRVAGESLEGIRATARDASGRVAEIARAAEEQARNSKQVAEAARRTSEHVQEISRAMTEQSQATEQLLENANTSVQMCRQMSTATEEQKSSARYITSNIEAITELIRSIQASTHAQERACGQAAETVTALLDHARQGASRVPALSQAIDQLRSNAHVMEGALERFGADGDAAQEPSEA
jgi:methyl-accepting chemotaxis protein